LIGIIIETSINETRQDMKRINQTHLVIQYELFCLR
jgi:hypothetical protein